MYVKRKFDSVSQDSEAPELPRIFLFLFWSALLHLTFFLALDEMRYDAHPGRATVLQVRLAARPAIPVPQQISDFSSETLKDLEAGLVDWTGAPLDFMRNQHKLQAEIPKNEAPSTDVADTDYYYKSIELEEQPVPVRQIAPDYPESAKDAGVEGYVKVLLLIDERGKVRHLEVLESKPQGVFEDATMNALRSMEFVPGQKGMLTVKSRMVIRIDFKVGPELQ